MRRPRGTGSIFTKRGIYWVKYYFRKKPYYKTTGKRGPEGLKAARDILRGVGSLDPAADKVSLRHLRVLIEADYALKDQVSVGHTLAAFDRLEDYFGDTPVLDAVKEMDAYLKTRKKSGAKPGTLRREVAAFRRGCTLAAEKGLIPGRPVIRSVAASPPRQGFVPAKAQETIEKNLPAELAVFVRFLYLSGWRRGKAASLTWKDVHMEEGAIDAPSSHAANKLRPGKLYFRMDPAMEELIEDRHAATGGLGYVFTYEGAPIGDFRTEWKAAVKAALRPDTRLHDYRRTRATLWDQAGIPMSEAMALGGWETPKTYLGYVQVQRSRLEEALAKAAVAEGRTPKKQTA